MTENYRIADINIQISGADMPWREPLSCFMSDDGAPPRCTIRVTDRPADVVPIYTYTNNRVRWGKLADGREICDCFSPEEGLISRMLLSPGMDEAELYLSRELGMIGHFMKPVMESLFYSLCIHEGGIVLHAAAVDWTGKALLFSAPSGTGKTTHADMWVRSLGAEYINGDRPLLKFRDGALHACGTAWSGSANIYRNVCVPLAAIVFLEQNSENRMIRLNPAQAMKYMLPRCFLPYHSAELMARAMDNADAVLQAADCWHLRCTPDTEAMELVKRCVTTSPRFRK